MMIFSTAPRTLVLLLCLSPVAAPPLFARAQATGSVIGSVRYGDTGKPAAGINLWLTDSLKESSVHPAPVAGEYVVKNTENTDRQWLAKVGADGQFEINNVPAGNYLVHTYAPPYLSPDDTIYPTSDALHIATGPTAAADALRVEVTAGHSSPLAIALQRGGSLEGTVLLGKGAPAQSDPTPHLGLAVNAERKLGPNRYARVGGAAHTDSKGHYELQGLGPGDYIVFVSAAGRMVPTAGGASRGSSGLPVYAPGTVRPSEATVVHITGTEPHSLDVSLLPASSLHRLEGTVPANDANAMRTALVRLYPKDEGGLTAATPLTATGNFSFEDVPDGLYTVSVEFPPEAEYVGLTPDGQGVRMRVRKPLYATTTADVAVHGQDVAGILIPLEPVAQ